MPFRLGPFHVARPIRSILPFLSCAQIDLVFASLRQKNQRLRQTLNEIRDPRICESLTTVIMSRAPLNLAANLTPGEIRRVHVRIG